MDFHIGDEVWWEDPDDGTSSGKYEVVDIDRDNNVLTLSDGSSIVEAYSDECVFPMDIFTIRD